MGNISECPKENVKRVFGVCSDMFWFSICINHIIMRNESDIMRLSYLENDVHF